MKIAFIGGDGRMVHVARRLEKRGAEVVTLALSSDAPAPVQALSELMGAGAIVLPLPVTRDGVRPTADSDLCPPPFEEIFALAGKDIPLLGGAISPSLSARASEAGVRLVDYYLDEELLQKNAYTTAEAALAMAARDLPVNLRGARFGVVGSGRIARALCELLLAVGARVGVYARNSVALGTLAARGAVPHLFEKGLPPVLDGSARAVFSTVPTPLLDDAALENLAPKTPLYDLGGGGVCREAAKKWDLPTPDCAALPGKYSPESAADDLFEALLRTLAKEGVTAE